MIAMKRVTTAHEHVFIDDRPFTVHVAASRREEQPVLVSRATGIPRTKSGRQRKVGAMLWKIFK